MAAFSGTLVAGTNLKDVEATVDRVRLIVATGSAAVAVLNWPRGLRVTLAVPAWRRPSGATDARDDRPSGGGPKS